MNEVYNSKEVISNAKYAPKKYLNHYQFPLTAKTNTSASGLSLNYVNMLVPEEVFTTQVAMTFTAHLDIGMDQNGAAMNLDCTLAQ